MKNDGVSLFDSIALFLLMLQKENRVDIAIPRMGCALTPDQ